MEPTDKAGTVDQAYDNLARQSLAKISGDVARLIYLASTRDYNTGKYHHAGLAAQFRAEIACQALEMAHRHVFGRIAGCPLETLVIEMDSYVKSSPQSREDVLEVWQKLEPYRVAIPLNINIAVAQLFISNIKVALAVLQHRRQHRAAGPSGS